jgi:hypothetical protein
MLLIGGNRMAGELVCEVFAELALPEMVYGSRFLANTRASLL